MDRERLIYLQGFAEGLAGTVQTKTAEEAQYIGELMVELVREVAFLAQVDLPEKKVSSGA